MCPSIDMCGYPENSDRDRNSNALQTVNYVIQTSKRTWNKEESMVLQQEL